MTQYEYLKMMALRDDALKEGECWEWPYRIRPNGYGEIRRPRGEGGLNTYPHREVLCIREVDIEGKSVDHLCRNRACFRPSHLKPMSQRENLLAKGSESRAARAHDTHCQRGHEFNEENTYIKRGGGRSCRECTRTSQRNNYRKKRGITND